ncbi:hypothetical protein C1645_759223 [Glomus cerebriforme]|uniref:Uncharacterized protein n=1 Tax=Glomus cerebriforme TaxID=658196 RepID=A0A397TEJ6_9GLOM|nr:hypothetical protein C1645_759223 [Glomus cerebriforme]
MSQNPISVVVNNKRLSMMFLSTPPPPFIESKNQENFKLCRVNLNGVCLPPSPNEIDRYEKWHDNNQDDYFSFPANYLATPNKARSKHSNQAFARLETLKENNNIPSTKLSQKAIVESPKTTTNEENLVLQLEDTAIPPMSPSCSTSTSEESDIDDLNQENSNVISKPPVLQKHLTREFDSYVSEFIRHSEFTMKVAKKRETPSVFGNFFN